MYVYYELWPYSPLCYHLPFSLPSGFFLSSSGLPSISMPVWCCLNIDAAFKRKHTIFFLLVLFNIVISASIQLLCGWMKLHEWNFIVHMCVFSFFKFIYFYCFVCTLSCLHISMYTMYVPGALWGQERAFDPLGLELQMNVRYRVHAGNWTQVLRKSSQCSWPLCYLSRPMYTVSFWVHFLMGTWVGSITRLLWMPSFL